MDIKRRHAVLPSISEMAERGGYTSYGELATDNLRRAIVDIGAQLSDSADGLDLASLQQRVVFALTCLEAHDPSIPRYDLDAEMPYSGRDDQKLVVTASAPTQKKDGRRFN